MKDNMNENAPDQHGDDEQDSPLADYTPQQRRTINQGLRILARVAIRSYLREHGAERQAETDTTPMEEKEV